MVAAIRRAMMTHRKFSVVALLLPAQQGKGLVEGKGFPGDWGSEGSQMAKCWPDDFTESNPLHVCTVREQNAGRRARWLSSKSILVSRHHCTNSKIKAVVLGRTNSGTVNLFADVRPNTQYLWIANLSGKALQHRSARHAFPRLEGLGA
jgi:hypothetical protein